MSEWTGEWTGYDPGTERLRESLCTLGNGYFATRGALPECRAGLVHCPGTYAAGCYDRLESAVAGRQVVNEDLVNLPNWLLLRFRLRGAGGAWGPWFSPCGHTLLDHRHTLDLRRARSPGPSATAATSRVCSVSSRSAWCTWGIRTWPRCGRSSRPRTGRERSRSRAPWTAR